MASTSPIPPASVSPAELYVSRLGTDKSRATTRCALRTLSCTLGSPIDWEHLSYADVAHARGALTRFSPAWGSTCLSVLRSVLQEARRLGLTDAAMVADAMALPPIRGQGGRLGRDVADAEIDALVDAVDGASLRGLRDGAVLGMLLGGLRCAETTTVEACDYDPSTGRLTVRAGKGRKHRVVPLGHVSQNLLENWLAHHPGTGPILRSVDRWGRLGSSLTPRGVQAALAGLCDDAGVPRLSPHAIRAHQITAIIEHGDVFLAQLYAGHADQSTTQRYDRRGLCDLENVVRSLALLSPPRMLRPTA